VLHGDRRLPPQRLHEDTVDDERGLALAGDDR
jgi:hypothetical protein